ncbi:MAG: NosD domain-containing protein [Thermoplasmata archaeon]
MLARSITLIAMFSFFIVFLNIKNVSAIDISNCSILDSENEIYFLMDDIINSDNTTCINITANNITLDCQGKIIDGKDTSASIGILITTQNVTIKNCNISDWSYGIYINNHRNFIDNITAYSNTHGIYLLNSNNNSIKGSKLQNNIGHGLFLSQANYNTLDNLTISNNQQNGIYLLNSQWNNISNVSSYSNIFNGINLSNSNYNNITFSKFYSNIGDGISLFSSSFNLILQINSTSNQKNGIYLESSSNNTIYNINSSKNYRNGFYLYSSSYNNFSNIYAIEDDTSGFYFETSSNNNFVKNSEIINNTNNGILSQLSSNNNFVNCKISFNKDIGIKLFNSNSHYFNDSIVSNSTNFDIYVWGSSNNYFINTTFNKSKTSIVSGAVIFVSWYLDVVVLNIENNNPIEDVNIIIKDSFNSVVFDGYTNSSGEIPRLILTEYNETSSGKNYYIPYQINASKFDFIENITYPDLTRSLVYRIYMKAIGPPFIVIRLYNLGLEETDFLKPGRIVRIRAFVNSWLGRDAIAESKIQIKNNLGENVVDDVLLSKISNLTNGYVYEYNYTIPENGVGTWWINISSKDERGKVGYGYKKMILSPINLEVKLILNSTSDNIYIPGYGEFTFSSLQANEYFSPKNYYIASYSNDILKGIIFAQLKPISLITEKSQNTYGLGTKQTFQNSMIFLVFSKGNWRSINNRIGLIEKGDFLSYPSPTFGFGLKKTYLKITIDYKNLDINKTTIFWKGYNQIIIENIGKTSNNKVGVIVEKI